METESQLSGERLLLSAPCWVREKSAPTEKINKVLLKKLGQDQRKAKKSNAPERRKGISLVSWRNRSAGADPSLRYY